MDFMISFLLDIPFYCFLALIFYLSFRIANFPDVSMDSSYGLGMAILVFLATNGVFGLPLIFGLVFSFIFGFGVGSLTGILNGVRFLRIPKLLAGLIVSFCMYSVNFRVNLHSTTRGLYTTKHELNALRELLGIEYYRVAAFAIWLFIFIFALSLIYLLLRSKQGLFLRIPGYRPKMFKESGKSPTFFIIVCLGLSNGLAALSGCLRAAIDNYSDINTFGTFFYALASLLLGEKILGQFRWGRKYRHSIKAQLIAVIIGGFSMSVIIELSIALLSKGLNTYFSPDIKFVLGILVLVVVSGSKKKIRELDTLSSL